MGHNTNSIRDRFICSRSSVWKIGGVHSLAFAEETILQAATPKHATSFLTRSFG